jgi:hypothetical protein
LSVSTRTNVHGRQPPSQWSVSTRAIFMSASCPGSGASRVPATLADLRRLA